MSYFRVPAEKQVITAITDLEVRLELERLRVITGQDWIITESFDQGFFGKFFSGEKPYRIGLRRDINYFVTPDLGNQQPAPIHWLSKSDVICMCRGISNAYAFATNKNMATLDAKQGDVIELADSTKLLKPQRIELAAIKVKIGALVYEGHADATRIRIAGSDRLWLSVDFETAR